ncbi:MAG: BON domain-containing protein [Chloroflexi bacterium]|nr:BON domain-containing protein [Chloroflexota bacterium]
MATTRADADIRQDVLEALTCDIRVDASNVDAEVVGGVVHLRGTVPSYFEKRTAADIVNRIKGVVDVVNELRVQPVTPRRDEDITIDVRAALKRDVWVDEDKVEVKTVGGVVYLSGTVESYTEKSYAEADAWSVVGVIDVVNNIVIAPKPTRTDEEIAAEVRNDLARNIRIDPTRIQVSVMNGTVYLRGTVSTIEQKWLADEVAWWTAGVRNVVNELQVQPAPDVGR